MLARSGNVALRYEFRVIGLGGSLPGVRYYIRLSWGSPIFCLESFLEGLSRTDYVSGRAFLDPETGEIQRNSSSR